MMHILQNSTNGMYNNKIKNKQRTTNIESHHKEKTLSTKKKDCVYATVI